MATFPQTLDIRVRLAPDDALCIDCRWWNAVDGVWGECRRRAPVMGGGHADKWPITRPVDLCGEWEAKP